MKHDIRPVVALIGIFAAGAAIALHEPRAFFFGVGLLIGAFATPD